MKNIIKSKSKGMEMVQVAILIAIAIAIGLIFRNRIEMFINSIFNQLDGQNFF